MLAGWCRVWVKGLAGVWVACQWVCRWVCRWVVTGHKGPANRLVTGHKGPASDASGG
jgi:hypothetical protein